MKVVDHIHLGLDEDGEAVAAYQTIKEARDAVDSKGHTEADIVDYHPDVPLMESTENNSKSDKDEDTYE